MGLNTLIELGGFFAMILGCTWHLSSKIENIAVTARMAKDLIEDHAKEDTRRFNRLHARLDDLHLQAGE